MNGRFEGFIRPQRSFAAWPTHDDQTLLVGRAVEGGFGEPGAAAIFRGSLEYGACLAP